MIILSGIIMTGFTILWIIKYPRLYCESLTFKNRRRVEDYFESIIAITWLLGSIFTICSIIERLK